MSRKSKIAGSIVWLSLISMLFTKGCSCWENNQLPEKKKESATSGNLTVISDDGLKPIVEKQVNEFVRIYTEAEISVGESPTNVAIEKLLNREVKSIVIGRKLNATEDSVIKKHSFDIKSDLIGRDAACIIVNQENPVESLTLPQLAGILSGKITDWSQVGGKPQAIQVFITGQNDGQRSYLQDSLHISAFAEKAYPCTTSAQMKAFVKKFRGSIGYASLSNVRELTDPVRRDTVRGLKLLPVGQPESKAYLPYQENVFKGLYPLTYGIYCVYWEYERLPKGFAAFLGREGQKVFLRNGVGPVEIPVTVIYFKEDE